MPGGQETKSERAANCRAGERVVSLEVEVGDFGVINHRKNVLFVEGAYQRSFRDWCSRDQERISTQ